MRKKQKINIFLCSLFKISLLGFLVGQLIGCACLEKRTYNASVPSSSLRQRCEQSAVLITNLARPAKDQTYLLPSGEPCPRDTV